MPLRALRSQHSREPSFCVVPTKKKKFRSIIDVNNENPTLGHMEIFHKATKNFKLVGVRTWDGQRLASMRIKTRKQERG